MDPAIAAKRRRLAVVSVCALVCGGAAVALLLLEPTYHRFLGISVTNGLTGAVYASATTLGVTTFRWLRSARPKEPRITVDELRRRGRSRR